MFLAGERIAWSKQCRDTKFLHGGVTRGSDIDAECVRRNRERASHHEAEADIQAESEEGGQWFRDHFNYHVFANADSGLGILHIECS